MGKFDFMNGNDINLDVQRTFITVRDLISALNNEFVATIPIYLSISKNTSFKLSKPKSLDMDSCVKVTADIKIISDLSIGIMRDICEPAGCLDLPIHVIFHGKDRLVRSFKICADKSKTIRIGLLID